MTAISSYATPSVCRRRTSASTKATSASVSGTGCAVGFGPAGFVARNSLCEAAQLARQPVRHRQHLGRGPVVVLQPDHRGVRVALREVEQVLGRRAGEGVDGLVVVAHHAELVAPAEPPVEQRLLQGVHVLVLVHRERLQPRADGIGGGGMFVEQAHRHQQHVLEVDPAGALLAALVPVVDTGHQLGRDRRLVIERLDGVEVAAPGDHPVLRPFDLAGQLAARHELVRRRQRVGQRGDERRLRSLDLGQTVAGVRFPQATQLGERRGVERPGLHALHAQGGEPLLELARRLLRERDRQDGLRRERTGGDLVRDAMRDGGGLAGPGAGEDGDRSPHRERRPPLFVVQRGEDRIGAAHAGTLPAPGDVRGGLNARSR